MDDLWQRFIATGSVADYLNYKQHNSEIKNNADADKGIDNKRADSWGE